jgi:Flp pilus assembly protein TadB
VAEAGRRQPITGTSRGPAAPRTKEDKAKARTTRSSKYEAMRRGEAWALNPRDRGPARALARDFVDSKRRISEYYMYVLVVLLAAVFVRSKAAQAIISPLVLALVLVILVDAMLIRRSLRRLMAERLPGESTRGLTTYSVMRALQIRRFRVPSPRVGPGGKF